MYRIILSIITILCIITGGHLMSIPVFGTKRYHRTPSISGSSSVPSSSSNIPYYNQLSTYYDNQPISSSLSIPYSSGNGGGSLSSIPIPTNLNSINNNNNYNQQQNGYLTENGYYYYPRHEYHSYGMPTYHGEYKPTPYYYAPAPHYSYYDDRDIISNPMDDLHEEILHEDERERQRELQPIPQLPQSYGQENWYQTHNNNNNNNNRQQQDELTNNFLKNLIEYNRQIDAQQKLQQQQQDELMQRDQEHKLQLQQYQQQFQQQNQQQPFNNDEYDEYVELDNYEYEPQASENIYDMKKYERLDNSQPIYQQQQQHQQQQQNVYNPLQQQKQLKSISSKQYENDDEDVRQLKSLAHHSNNVQNLEASSKSPKSHHKTYKIKDFSDSSIEEDIIDSSDNFNHYASNNNNNNNWNQVQKEQPIQSQVKSYAQYDNEPEEYDDDAWISWDRKRSPLEPNQNKWHKSLKKIESIKAFNNRKQPIIVKVKDFKESTSTTKHNQIPETSTKVSTGTTATTKNDQIMSTTNIIPIKMNEKLFKTSGQKEIVIPRPAVINPQTNMFTSGFGMFNTNKNIHQSKQFDPINLVVKQNDDDDVNVKENMLLKKKTSLKDDDLKRNGKENVYDTIKQLLAMEQQLEKTPLTSKVQKRFVTNEESLVNELNNLKRNST